MTDYFIAQSGDLWERYVDHPFAVQLGNGTLPMKAFVYFIRQGYRFLLSYARIHALAAYKSKSFLELEASTLIVQSTLEETQVNTKVGWSRSRCASEDGKMQDLGERMMPTCRLLTMFPIRGSRAILHSPLLVLQICEAQGISREELDATKESTICMQRTAVISWT